jgi:hypothetical protein
LSERRRLTVLRLAGAIAVVFYLVVVTLVVLSFTTEYNLAQGIVFAYLAALSLGMAVAATAVFLLILAVRGNRSGNSI